MMSQRNSHELKAVMRKMCTKRTLCRNCTGEEKTGNPTKLGFVFMLCTRPSACNPVAESLLIYFIY